MNNLTGKTTLEERWLIPDWPAPSQVKALSTLRQGGVSKNPFASLNISYRVGDSAEAVTQNRTLLRNAANLPSEPRWLNQVNGTGVINLQDFPVNSTHEADAALSFQNNQICVVTTADCLPVLLCDIDGSCVAAVHAGWRGLVNGIIEKTVRNLNCPASRLLAWLGPALGPEAFEGQTKVKSKG